MALSAHPNNCKCEFCRDLKGKPIELVTELTDAQRRDLVPRAWELHIKGERSADIADTLLAGHELRLRLRSLTAAQVDDLIAEAQRQLMVASDDESIEAKTERYVSQQTAIMHDGWVRLQNLPATAGGAAAIQRNIMEASKNVADVYDIRGNKDNLKQVEETARFRHVVLQAIERAAPEVAEAIKRELMLALKGPQKLIGAPPVPKDVVADL